MIQCHYIYTVIIKRFVHTYNLLKDIINITDFLLKQLINFTIFASIFLQSNEEILDEIKKKNHKIENVLKHRRNQEGKYSISQYKEHKTKQVKFNLLKFC